MQDTAEHSQNGYQPTAEQVLDKLDLTEAAIRLGIGVDGVRRRLQRGSLQGLKEEGKWFVLLPAEQVQNGVQQDAEHPNQSTEQELEIAEQRYTGFLEAQNEKLWKELEERRREVSELHILLRREQERGDQRQLTAPIDYVSTVQQSHDTAEQVQNSKKKRKRWWTLFAP